MLIDVTGNHIEITAALKEHITKKMEKIEKKFTKIIHVHVVLSVDKKYQHKAEATVNLSGADLHANHECEDMYMSIDKMVDKLNTQIVKYKEKLKDHSGENMRHPDSDEEF